MQREIEEDLIRKLQERDADELMRKAGKGPTIMLPEAIAKDVSKSFLT